MTLQRTAKVAIAVFLILAFSVGFASCKREESNTQVDADMMGNNVNAVQETIVYTTALPVPGSPDYLADIVETPPEEKNSEAQQKPPEKKSKRLYMTFDDGPSKNTGKILDTLDRYGAKATFFVIYHDGKYENAYKDIVDHGQTIALHTYSHDFYSVYSSEEAYFQDLNKISDYVYDLTGVRSTLIRFPGGSSNTLSKYNPGIMTKLTDDVTQRGYTYYDWNSSVQDAEGRELSVSELLDNAQKYMYDDMVLLLHDTDAHPTTCDSVGPIVEYFQSEGYQCLALDDRAPNAHHKVLN